MDNLFYINNRSMQLLRLVTVISTLVTAYTAEFYTLSPKVNSWMTTENLQKVFDPPNCLDTRTVCKAVSPNGVQTYLTREVNQSVERLCLKIKPVYDEREIVLTPLSNLTSLESLWIIPEKVINTIRFYPVKIHFPENTTNNATLTKLHINVPIKSEHTKSLFPFIQSLNTLNVLDLGFTAEMNSKTLLSKVIEGLEGKQLIALSLKGFQQVSLVLKGFSDILNVTQLLWPLRNCPLQYLDLSHNGLVFMIPGIYSVTKNLRILDVSHNNMVADTNTAMWLELLLHPMIEILHINNQGYPGQLTRSLYKTGHSVSNLQTNVLENIEQCMHKLNISAKELHVKKYFCQIIYCLNPQYFAGIPCAVLPSYNEVINLIDSSCSFRIQFPLGIHLKELYMDSLLAISSNDPILKNLTLCFRRSTKIQTLTFSNNAKITMDTYFQESMNKITVKGLDQVSHLDMSNNALPTSLYNSFFQSFGSLKYLYLSGNFITLQNADICHGIRGLKVLDLSNNNLTTIPGHFVDHCDNLNVLDISLNALTDMLTHFSATYKIQCINASNNAIKSLSQEAINNIKKLGSKSQLRIDLSNNPLDCGCSGLDNLIFLQSAAASNITFLKLETYECYGQRGYSFLVDINLDDLHRSCFPSHLELIVLTVISTTSVLSLFFCVFCCYKCRYRINTFYFRICHRMHHNTKSDPSSDIAYDAFISYAAEDRFWVHDVLRTQLEDKYGFRLCLHYRDFPSCGDIADVIVNFIRRSHSIVVILSDNSVRRPWCEFELKSAHAQHLNQGKRLIIVKLGKIPKDEDLSDLVTDLLNSKVYIEWPETGIRPTRSEKRKQELFWTKVEKAIYGEDYCGCFRYCNPCYDKNNSLTMPLLDDSLDTK